MTLNKIIYKCNSIPANTPFFLWYRETDSQLFFRWSVLIHKADEATACRTRFSVVPFPSSCGVNAHLKTALLTGFCLLPQSPLAFLCQEVAVPGFCRYCCFFLSIIPVPNPETSSLVTQSSAQVSPPHKAVLAALPPRVMVPALNSIMAPTYPLYC